MKKRNKIILFILAIVLLIFAGYGIYQGTIKKETKIDTIKEYNYFLLKQDSNYGIINKEGNIVISPQYSEIQIPNPEKAVFVCYQGKNSKVLNDKNEEILTDYKQVQTIKLKNISSDLLYEKSALSYEQDGKYGLISLEGKKITKPIYEQIEGLPYKEGELIVKQNDKYGVITNRGNELIKPQYDEVKLDEYYTDQNAYQYAGYHVLLKTQEGYRYGYLNAKGKEILPTQYNEISRVTDILDDQNAYLICSQNGQYGVTKNKETILEKEYQSIQFDENNQVFIVEKSKKYGISNLEGKIIIPIQYDEIDITGIYLYAKNEQGITVYNSDGTQANVDSDIAILKTSNEKYKIKINNEGTTKYGVIDQDGKILVEENYHYIEYLYDQYFIASNENGKLGIIDDKGETKVELNHDSLQRIPETDFIQATLAENQITEIYDKNMEKICEMENARIEVKDNYIQVLNETETKYYSKEGKELKNTEVYPEHPLFVIEKDGKYGFADKQGNKIVDYQYDKAYELNEYGFATIRKDGKWGAINQQGQEVVTPSYEIKEQTEPFFIGKYYRVTYGFGEFYYTKD